ncbi:MAG TPA: hypothetical protein VEL09_07020 [Burkholderiales bacterium]|nr:hypothetical protein [Burkholderiales bacterium]
MRPALRQRGQLLVAAVVLIVVIALMIVALGFLYVSSERSSILHNQSGTAYAAAYSGIEVAKYQFSTGTACTALTNTNLPVGSGQFTTGGTPYPTAFTATLASNIPAGSVSSVPLTFTSGNLSNLAPHGEITIGTESIDYGSTSDTGSACSPAPCLGGVVRGANGTTAAAHTTGNAVTQANQCVIASTGTAGGAKRILESTVQASSSGVSNSFTSGSIQLTTAPATTSLTSGWAPNLPAGDNYVFAIVTFSNTAAHTTIPAGNLKLVATSPAATLQSSTSLIDVGGGATAGANSFPQETQFLMGKHAAAPAGATYDVTVTSPSNTNTFARVQILAISGIASANASFIQGTLTGIGTSATTLVTSGAITAGNNIVIAQVQLDGSSGQLRNITNLSVQKGGTPIISNAFTITLDKTGNVNQGTGALLMAIDSNAVAGQTYTVSALASGGGTKGSASILVFNGFNGAVGFTSPSVTFTAASTLLSVPTSFPAGENVVLAAIQYQNTSGASVNIGAGPAEKITVSAATVSSNAYTWNLCSGTAECDDFYSGLLGRQSAGTANPSFVVSSAASGSTVGVANLLAISLSGGVRRINTIEVYPP